MRKLLPLLTTNAGSREMAACLSASSGASMIRQSPSGPSALIGSLGSAVVMSRKVSAGTTRWQEETEDLDDLAGNLGYEMNLGTGGNGAPGEKRDIHGLSTGGCDVHVTAALSRKPVK